MGQRVRLDRDGVVCAGARQTDSTTALGPNDAADQSPAMWRWPEAGGVLTTAQRNSRSDSLKAGRTRAAAAPPEEGGFTAIVPGRQGALVFPDAAQRQVVLEVLANARKVLHDRNSQPTQFRRIPDTREHQHLRCVH